MYTKKRGFTLMELLVAVGLMAVLFASLSTVFKQATDLIRRSEAEIGVYQTFRLVSKIMKKDFESVINYDEPVFYNRYDEYGDRTRIDTKDDYRGKLDYCGYLRIEGHNVPDGANTRVVDNISFLASDSSRLQIQNYLDTQSVGGTTVSYVKTNVVGSDMVEISYLVEDRAGLVVGVSAGVDPAVNRWRLVRLVRQVMPKECVSLAEKGLGFFGLVYKGYESIDRLNGKGPQGLAVFNGRGLDRRVALDFTSVGGIRRVRGLAEAPEKYGRRDIVAEGCAEFDVKYWYYRKDAPDENWQERAWAAGIDGNPLPGRVDPYVAVGHFFNGMPPNPACMRTDLNGSDDENESQYGRAASADRFAGSHPNWWYLPRMMQVRLVLTDNYHEIEQPFWTRVFLPASDPYPRVP
ncbi:MAG: type II secretion system protein [Planctomycetota bacterium]